MTKKGVERKEQRTGFLFMSPVLIWYTIFFFIPLGFVLVLSFVKWDMFGPMKFIGLKNFKTLFGEPYFLKALSISLIYALSTTSLLVSLGMMFALFLDRPGPVAYLGRVLMFMLAVLPLIPTGAIWVWITGPERYSALNTVAIFLGMDTKKWLSDTNLALACVIGFIVWKNTGYNALIYTAGLRGIPVVYYEAARIDGASRFQLIMYITIPLLKPIIVFLVIINLISGWNVFTPVWFLTKGGPGSATKVITAYIYQYGFQRFRYGFASSATILLVSIIFILTYFQRRLSR